MELYNLEDANYLIKYYTPLMVGKDISEEVPAKIILVNKETYNVNEYRVNAICQPVNGNLHFKRSIGKMVNDLNLDLPEVVLKNQDQS